MAGRGLRAIQPKTYVPKTNDGRADKPSANLLLGNDLPDQPDRVWAGVITFIPTEAGWLYLAVVIDLFTRRIVGWLLARHMRARLVADASGQDLGTRHPAPCSGRQACSYHNAWTESFMGTLKTEMLQGGCFIDEHDARTEIFAFIEGYYNTQRKHSSLGYRSPAQFETGLNSLN